MKSGMIALLNALASIGDAYRAQALAAFQLSSAAFAPGAAMPLDGLDCHGPNTSPALQPSGAPAGTKSYALISDDYEAGGGDGFIQST